MFGLGFAEIAVLLVISLFLFGDKLPGLMRWLGHSVTEFKKEANSLTEDIHRPVK